uniref:Uncharacterized protein n=1 Tax=Rhizophora mucronata TaxID=61149 RepID=A0A2P2IGY6_RHIMU
MEGHCKQCMPKKLPRQIRELSQSFCG